MSKINCMLCGESVHSIEVHLRKAHGPGSSEPMNLVDYQHKWPNAPIMSETALQMLEQKRKEREAQAGTSQAAAATVDNGPKPAKVALHELFNLAGPEAMSSKGKPIMISVSQQTGYEELIPVAEEYYPNVEPLKNVLMGIEMNIPVMYWGPAGIGKTAIFRYISHHTRRRMVRVQHLADLERAHVIGERTVRKDVDDDGKVHTHVVFEFGPLPLAMKHGWLYLADEIDRALPEVLSAYQAVLEGQPLYIEEAPEGERLIHPHPDFRFVATGNTNGMGDDSGMYRATMRQDAATFERFGIVQEADYPDRKIEVEMMVKKARTSSKDAERLVDYASKVRGMYPSEMSLPVGPRVLLNIAKIGIGRADFVKGVELAYANRLPAAEKKAALDLAKRILA